MTLAKQAKWPFVSSLQTNIEDTGLHRIPEACLLHVLLSCTQERGDDSVIFLPIYTEPEPLDTTSSGLDAPATYQM